VIIAAEVMTACPDFGHLGPMVAAAQSELAAAAVTEAPQVLLRRRLLAPGADERDHRPGHPGPDPVRFEPPRRQAPRLERRRYDFMRAVLSTDRGAELYKQRGQLIEPIFGHIKHNRRFDRLHRRGRSAARTESRLMATTHNLVKLHQHFTAAVA
jgi:hypothetical protein